MSFSPEGTIDLLIWWNVNFIVRYPLDLVILIDAGIVNMQNIDANSQVYWIFTHWGSCWSLYFASVQAFPGNPLLTWINDSLSLRMDKLFHPAHNNECNYFSRFGLKSIHVNKTGHCYKNRILSRPLPSVDTVVSYNQLLHRRYLEFYHVKVIISSVEI